MQTNTYDYIILGAGVMGLSAARSLLKHKPSAKILILEKESREAEHASGRNSGVLHAGFYYTADTLKAKFCVEGNRQWREFAQSRKLKLKDIGKLVVAANEKELEQLYELEKRGKANGSQVEIISAERAREIEPAAKTYAKALWSPLTAVIDPREICRSLKEELEADGVRFIFNNSYRKWSKDKSGQSLTLHTAAAESYQTRHLINCAGLYADKVAKDFGFGEHYTIIPFKGLYLKYTKNSEDLRTNIYPVPNLKHTFLGVHFTKTVHDQIKIGPTAIPAFWREHYNWLDNFQLGELLSILYYEAKLFLTNSFGFRDLAFEEMKKYSKAYLVKLASTLAQGPDPKGFTEFGPPGIRAQLVDKRTLKLLMDFIIEGDALSTHFLNAISPGFTCSLPFADYAVENFVLKAEARLQEEIPSAHNTVA